MEDEAENAAAVLVEPHRLGGREATKRSVCDSRQQDGRDDLGGDDADNRFRDAEMGADGEPGHPQPHRRGEQPGAHVVALAEDERGAGDTLGALQEGQACGDEERDREVGPAEDRVGRRRDRHEHDACRETSGRLHEKRLSKQAAQPSPGLSRRVVEAVLHERLLGGEVEQALEEARRDHHHGEQAEVLGAELPGREQRSEKAERDGDIDAGRRSGAPEADRAEAFGQPFERRSPSNGGQYSGRPWRYPRLRTAARAPRRPR